MASTKKATAAKTTKKDETAEMAAAAKKAAQASKSAEAPAPVAAKEEKKAPAKKTAPKKVAPKKVAPKKPAAAETKVDFFVEFGGVQVSIDEVVKNVKATYGKDAENISVYLKPEESKAYFVADGEEHDMDVFFC